MILLFADETGIERLSLFHDLVVCFDREVEAVQQNDHPRPGLAHRSSPWAFLSELSFPVSFTKRHLARSLYRRSNSNLLVESFSPNLSVHCFESEWQFPLSQQSHQQLCPCTDSAKS